MVTALTIAMAETGGALAGTFLKDFAYLSMR